MRCSRIGIYAGADHPEVCRSCFKSFRPTLAHEHYIRSIADRNPCKLCGNVWRVTSIGSRRMYIPKARTKSTRFDESESVSVESKESPTAKSTKPVLSAGALLFIQVFGHRTKSQILSMSSGAVPVVRRLPPAMID